MNTYIRDPDIIQRSYFLENMIYTRPFELIMIEKIGSLQLFYDWFATYICQKRDLATSDYG